MAQYGYLISPLYPDPRYGGQPRINAKNAFINSSQLHVNFVPFNQDMSRPTDAAGLEGADVFGPAPGWGPQTDG
jgi:hypothetical protein